MTCTLSECPVSFEYYDTTRRIIRYSMDTHSVLHTKTNSLIRRQRTTPTIQSRNRQGIKLMELTDSSGIPLAVHIASAAPNEVTLVRVDSPALLPSSSTPATHR